MSLRFEWNETKAIINRRTHGISFDEARTVFFDPNSLTIFDGLHSDAEERYIDLGVSARGRILVVVYTERENRIRIISCRRATTKEIQQYGQQSI